MRRRGERDVALAGEQTRCGVHPDPAGARQVDFGPGVQVGEIRRGAGRPVDRGRVGHELDQVAGDEPGGEPDPAQHLHEQPRRVAAGAALQPQGLGRGLDARLHPDAVGGLPGDQAVQRHQELDGAGLLRETGEQRLHLRTLRVDGGEVGGQLLGETAIVRERPDLRVILHEEVERVDHRHVGGEVDLDLQFVGLLREDEAGEPVATGILLPVQEVVGRRHRERVGRDLGAGVRGRTQADHLGAQADRPVVAVMRDVVQGGFDRHDGSVERIERGRAAGPWRRRPPHGYAIRPRRQAISVRRAGTAAPGRNFAARPRLTGRWVGRRPGTAR